MHTLFPDAALQAASQIHYKWPAYRTLPKFACCTKFMYVNAGTTTRLLDISQELEKEHWQKKKKAEFITVTQKLSAALLRHLKDCD